MKNSAVKAFWHRCGLALGAGAAALVLSSGAWAQHAGGGGGGHAGGGGGGHAMGGGHAGGYGGGYHGGYGGYHGGYGGYHGGYGGYHGGYYHGGYGGWHGGYWHGGYWHGGWGCCGWGWWGPGLALGLYFSTLPLYYSTYWWDGVPYYYADNTFYTWNPSVGQYETVEPPPSVASQVQGQTGGGPSGDLIVYPKNGQSEEQTAKDKYECYQWAASQSGYDPAKGAAVDPSKRSDYMRADAACLTGRGYTVD